MTTDAPQTVHSIGTNLEGFADALDQLGRHAAAMDQAEELNHEACVYCETMILLARVVGFGDQLRGERRGRP